MYDYGIVSIIMPNWNCAGLISATIKSVIAQTYPNWELLIQDDCSTDGVELVLGPFVKADNRIKVERNKKNSGAAITRNNAIRRARGRWIAFLDSDDLWLPNKLEHQLKFMIENKHHFSYTNYCEINDSDRETGVVISGPTHITKVGMYAFCWPGCLTVMYDREEVGLVQIEDIKKNNDYAMWLKVCKKADCYLLDECLAKYRRGRSGSISTHGYTTLIKWHYRLWHCAEQLNPVLSMFLTCTNLIFGVYKKIRFVKSGLYKTAPDSPIIIKTT